MLDAYATADRLKATANAKDSDARYPQNALGSRLQLIARLLKVGVGARVYYTTQGGWRTNKKNGRILAEVSSAPCANPDPLPRLPTVS